MGIIRCAKFLSKVSENLEPERDSKPPAKAGANINILYIPGEAESFGCQSKIG